MAVRSSDLRKSENQTPSVFFKITKISQIKKNVIISLTELNLSFSRLEATLTHAIKNP